MYKEIRQTLLLGDCQLANVHAQQTCVTCCQRVSYATRARDSNASTLTRSFDKPASCQRHREDPVVMHDTPSDDVPPSRVVSSPARVETSPVRRGTRARKLPSYLADYQP